MEINPNNEVLDSMSHYSQNSHDIDYDDMTTYSLQDWQSQSWLVYDETRLNEALGQSDQLQVASSEEMYSDIIDPSVVQSNLYTENVINNDLSDVKSPNEIFHPESLVLLILEHDEDLDTMYSRRKIYIDYNDETSAIMTLEFVNPTAESCELTSKEELRTKDAEEYSSICDDISSISPNTSHTIIRNKYILDIQARIVAKEARDSDTNEVLSCIFYYSRRDVNAVWHVFPSAMAGFEELQSLDFLFGQYVYYDNHHKLNEAEKILGEKIPKLNRERDTNIVAKGLEGTGNLVRIALKQTGAVTGMGIRGLGRLYTKASVKSREILGKPVAATDKRNSEGNLSNAATKERDISSGNMSAYDKYSSQSDHRDHMAYESKGLSSDVDDPEDQSTQNKAEGYRKPVTQESADVAEKNRKRAETVHASAVTLTGAALYPVRWTGKKAAEWASPGNTNIEVTTTTTKVEKVLKNNTVTKAVNDTFGGLFNAVVSSFKGVTEALDEIGSAIGTAAIDHANTIHGEEYCDKITKQYVNAAGEIGLASYKVLNVAAFGLMGIAADAAVEGATFLTCLSEFLVGPIILQGYMDTVQYPLLTPKEYFVVLRPWSIAFYRNASDIRSRPSKIVITAMLDTLPKVRNYSRSPSGNNLSDSQSGKYDSESRVSDEKKANDPFFDRLRGGNRPHLEICTVDCSTYLIYPPESQILAWYHELKLASKRVETVAKEKSGADEISLERRLRMLPKPQVLVITIKCCVLDILSTGICVSASSDYMSENYEDDLEVDVSSLNGLHDPSNNMDTLEDTSSAVEADHLPTAAAVPCDIFDRQSDPLRRQLSAASDSTVGSTAGHTCMNGSHEDGISTVPALPTRKSVQGTFETVPSMMGRSISTIQRSTVKSVRVRVIPLSERGKTIKIEVNSMRNVAVSVVYRYLCSRGDVY